MITINVTSSLLAHSNTAATILCTAVDQYSNTAEHSSVTPSVILIYNNSEQHNTVGNTANTILL